MRGGPPLARGAASLGQVNGILRVVVRELRRTVAVLATHGAGVANREPRAPVVRTLRSLERANARRLALVRHEWRHGGDLTCEEDRGTQPEPRSVGRVHE